LDLEKVRDIWDNLVSGGSQYVEVDDKSKIDPLIDLLQARSEGKSGDLDIRVVNFKIDPTRGEVDLESAIESLEFENPNKNIRLVTINPLVGEKSSGSLKCRQDFWRGLADRHNTVVIPQ
jgi:hypothetical protein